MSPPGLGGHGRKKSARAAVSTWGWPAAPMKDNQLCCQRARQGLTRDEALRKGHFPDLAVDPPHNTGLDCSLVPSCKVTSKAWEENSHHCNSWWTELLSSGKRSSPHHTSGQRLGGRWHCLGKVDRTRVTFPAQAERLRSHHLQPYSMTPRKQCKDDPFLTWTHHQPT